MKPIAAIVCFSILLYGALFSQSTIILQPGPAEGKDAEIWSLQPNSVYEDDLVRGLGWTFNGVYGIVRAFIHFDLSSLPEGSEIDSAYLSLYAPHSPHMQFHSGESAAYLRRIISDWDDATVSWNHQPLSTDVHQVDLPKASAEYQDYPHINVTTLVRDMVNDPSGSFGFMLILQDERKYNRISFCASEYPDHTKHPKLEIYYRTSDEEPGQGEQSDIVFLPNPYTDFIKILMSKPVPSIRLQILDVVGRLLYDQHIDPAVPFDMSSLPAALYVVRCLGANGDVLGKAKMIKIQK